MKKTLFSIIAIAVIGLSSCKKDDDCSLSAESLKGTYKITAMTSQAPGGPVEDILLATYESCELDDLVIFADNSVYIYNDAGIECSTPGDETGTWSLSGNTLTLFGDNLTISEFNCNYFKITEVDMGVTYTTTLTRQ